MVPLFDPGPIDHPDIPIHVAVIGPNMTAMAGSVPTASVCIRW